MVAEFAGAHRLRPRDGPRPSADRATARDRRLGYLLVAPVIILLLAVTALPLAYNVWNSLHADNLSAGRAGGKFVGVHNYSKMFSPRRVAGRARADARVRRGLGRVRDRRSRSGSR